MAKKIKSFTADEEIYNKIVSMFRQYKAETSISMYLNNSLKRLLSCLENIEKGINEMNYSIPMSFVIDDIVKNAGYWEIVSAEYEEEDQVESPLELILNEIKNDYEADQKGIPRELYRWLEMGYEISRDKKFLILKRTGEKFIPHKDGLLQVREYDPENDEKDE
ncbi:MAG TPA: hypothetical protein DCE78_04945 [Bacteroidetes bacterium]|jgi:hypothetical protein|nr:hypothetical protein [Bacteroidota bacterium]